MEGKVLAPWFLIQQGTMYLQPQFNHRGRFLDNRRQQLLNDYWSFLGYLVPHCFLRLFRVVSWLRHSAIFLNWGFIVGAGAMGYDRPTGCTSRKQNFVPLPPSPQHVFHYHQAKVKVGCLCPLQLFTSVLLEKGKQKFEHAPRAPDNWADMPEAPPW